MKIWNYILVDLSLFFLLLVDGQFSTLLVGIFPLSFHVISHLLFIGFLWISLLYSRKHIIAVGVVLGFIYDIYFFNFLGLAVFLFPICLFLFTTYNKFFYKNIWTYLLSLTILIFLFEIVTYMVAVFIGLTGMEFSSFIVNALLPTLLWNILCTVLSYPIFRKIFI